MWRGEGKFLSRVSAVTRTGCSLGLVTCVSLAEVTGHTGQTWNVIRWTMCQRHSSRSTSWVHPAGDFLSNKYWWQLLPAYHIIYCAKQLVGICWHMRSILYKRSSTHLFLSAVFKPQSGSLVLLSARQRWLMPNFSFPKGYDMWFLFTHTSN